MSAVVVALAVLAGALAVALALEHRRRRREERAAREQRAGDAAEIERLSAERDDRAAAAVAAAVRADDAEARATELEARRRDTETDLRDAEARCAEAERGVADAEVLWELELVRSERTWRHSVAAAPDQPSPFDDAADPLGLAVAVEVAALREDVGAAMELHWDATAEGASRCLTVLRVAQELLAVAAREQQAVVLRGLDADRGAVELHLTAPGGDRRLRIRPPSCTERLVSVAETDDSVVVTVHGTVPQSHAPLP